MQLLKINVILENFLQARNIGTTPQRRNDVE